MAEKAKKAPEVSAEDLQALKEQIIAEAKAEARKIIAEAKAQVEPPKPAEPVKDDGDELVTVRLPFIKGAGAKFVAVNGENVLIPRGKDVKIKKKFYYVLQQSEEQSELALKMMQGLADDYTVKSKDY